MTNPIKEFISSVLIIDDKKEEIDGLKDILEKEDILVTFLNPKKAKKTKLKHNRNLIFLDLYISDIATELNGHISEIRNILKKILPQNFGTYGLVIWSKHAEEISEFIKKLSIDRSEKKYPMPLFIVSLPKLTYLSKGFSTFFEDLDEKLKSNIAANFFINWYVDTKKGIFETIEDLYALSENYKFQNKVVESTLKEMATSYAGLPNGENNPELAIAAFKSVDDLFCSNLKMSKKNPPKDLFTSELYKQRLAEELKHFAKLNSKLLLEKNTANNFIFPGNIYKVKKQDSFLTTALEDFENIKTMGGEVIAMEITPPCDFQNKKHNSKLIGGKLINLTEILENLEEVINTAKEQRIKQEKNVVTACERKKIVEIEQADIAKAEEDAKTKIRGLLFELKGQFLYIVWPLYMNNCYYIMVFNFHNEKVVIDKDLKNKKSYACIFRAKPTFLADILQKYASNKARPGIACLEPNTEKSTKKCQNSLNLH